MGFSVKWIIRLKYLSEFKVMIWVTSGGGLSIGYTYILLGLLTSIMDDPNATTQGNERKVMHQWTNSHVG